MRAHRRRFENFMKIKATSHQIHMFLSRNRLTPGINWSGSAKSSMADHYADDDERYGITEAVFIRLLDEFGST